jgi:hypothetical protein
MNYLCFLRERLKYFLIVLTLQNINYNMVLLLEMLAALNNNLKIYLNGVK